MVIIHCGSDPFRENYFCPASDKNLNKARGGKMSDRYDRILSERRSLLAQFQGPIHSSNCPAVAATLQRFLRTGVVHRAPDVPRGFGCQDAGEPFISTNIPSLIRVMRQGSHGFNVVVGARNPSTQREHYANIVNIRGNIYYVDAFNNPTTLRPGFPGQLNSNIQGDMSAGSCRFNSPENFVVFRAYHRT